MKPAILQAVVFSPYVLLADFTKSSYLKMDMFYYVEGYIVTTALHHLRIIFIKLIFS